MNKFELEPHEFNFCIYREPKDDGLIFIYTVYSLEECITERVPKIRLWEYIKY